MAAGRPSAGTPAGGHVLVSQKCFLMYRQKGLEHHPCSICLLQLWWMPPFRSPYTGTRCCAQVYSNPSARILRLQSPSSQCSDITLQDRHASCNVRSFRPSLWITLRGATFSSLATCCAALSVAFLSSSGSHTSTFWLLCWCISFSIAHCAAHALQCRLNKSAYMHVPIPRAMPLRWEWIPEAELAMYTITMFGCTGLRSCCCS